MKPLFTLFAWLALALALSWAVMLWLPGWINPGPLLAGHARHADDCTQCHQLWRGPDQDLCLKCHPLDRIDAARRTAGKPAFHAMLREKRCLDCHPDHQGPQPPRQTFAHDLLPAAQLQSCQSCHQPPRDRLHEGITHNCHLCHRTRGWSTKEMDHDRFFRFDRQHPADCRSCHPGQDYRRYTCYGCHEHSPGKVAEEHREEGIYQFEQCVQCHRSSDEEEAERIWRQLRRERGMTDGAGWGRHHDDDDDD